MKKQTISLFLALFLLLNLLTPVSAATTAPEAVIHVENPLYADYPAPERTDQEDQSDAQYAATRAASYLSPLDAAARLRQAMVNRVSEITLYVEISDYWFQDKNHNWFVNDFFPLVVEDELGSSGYDGDYLTWSWRSYDAQLSGHTGTSYTFQVSLDYYTTLEEEQALQQGVTQLAQTLALADKTPFDAYTAIYDYITTHVTYDYDALNALFDGDNSNDDFSILTAYGALFNGRAVCQGFSTLYYALCWEAGLPVRILTSTTHAWNIVYLKDIWYEIDCTWDSALEGHRLWYLRGWEAFDVGPHIREDKFLTEEFLQRYPICRYDYDPQILYNDVPRSNVHYDNIRRSTELNLFNGTSEYTFSPALEINRAMVVTVLWRLEGSPAAPDAGFLDVDRDQYYYDSVNWAAANGIVLGMGDGTFQPEGNATREQLMTMLSRYTVFRGKALTQDSTLSQFTDAREISPYALQAMRWAVSNGIMNGTSQVTLSPQGSATREQLASFLVRLIDRYGF